MGVKKVSELEAEWESLNSATDYLKAESIDLINIEEVISQSVVASTNTETGEVTYTNWYYYKGGCYLTNEGAAKEARNGEINSNISALSERIKALGSAHLRLLSIKEKVGESKSQLTQDKEKVGKFKQALSEIGQMQQAAYNSGTSASIKAAFDCEPSLSLQNTVDDFKVLQKSINGANLDAVVTDLDNLIERDETIERRIQTRKIRLEAVKPGFENELERQRGMLS